MRKLNPFMALGYFIAVAVFLEMWDACKPKKPAHMTWEDTTSVWEK